MLGEDAEAAENLARSLEAAEWAQMALEAKLQEKAEAWGMPVLSRQPLVYAD